MTKERGKSKVKLRSKASFYEKMGKYLQLGYSEKEATKKVENELKKGGDFMKEGYGYCDNTNCMRPDDIQRLYRVKLTKEFEYDECLWCKNCIKTDMNMILYWVDPERLKI